MMTLFDNKQRQLWRVTDNELTSVYTNMKFVRSSICENTNPTK